MDKWIFLFIVSAVLTGLVWGWVCGYQAGMRDARASDSSERKQ